MNEHLVILVEGLDKQIELGYMVAIPVSQREYGYRIENMSPNKAQWYGLRDPYL